MRSSLIIIPLVLVLIQSIHSQTLIEGKLIDAETKSVVSGAHVIELNHKTACVSLSDGQFRLNVKSIPTQLEIRHIAYSTKVIEIKSKKDSSIIIELEPKHYPIDEITVRADPVIDLIEKRPLYVFDYEFYKDEILLLAYYQNSFAKPWLLLYSREGDSISAIPVKKPRALFKDCTDRVHLICQSKVYQIEYEDSSLSLWYPTMPEEFEETMTPCLEKLGDRYYFNQYLYKNQMLIYFYFDDKEKLYNDLVQISDSLKLFLLQDEARFASMGSYNEFDKLFADMVVYAPVYAPLCKIDTLLYIFDFTNDRLMTFTRNGDSISTIGIEFHKDRNWKKELFVDEAFNKVYSYFKNNGRSAIAGINLQSGKLENEILIPDYPFIEKIQVNKGFVYFLYKEKVGNPYKKLYKMEVPNTF